MLDGCVVTTYIPLERCAIYMPTGHVFYFPQESELTMLPVATPNIDEPVDRRTSARVPFGAVLGVIEHNGTLPHASEFRPVKALDLSQTGISFITTRWPSSDWVVVMLGDQQNPSYATARVVGCQSLSANPAEKRFEVRCEFEEWLQAAE